MFGFKWLEAVDSGEHEISRPTPISESSLPLGRTEARFDGTGGYRLEIRYRVTWNDFGGFFQRHVFDPVD